MLEPDRSQYRGLFDQYKSESSFFPLIGSVLSDQQNGVVYVDNIDHPEQVYVEHEFGFAQIFGRPVAGFESRLQRYLLVEKEFFAPKVRLYGTYTPEFLNSPHCDPLRSYRQRFNIDEASFVECDPIRMESAGLQSGKVDQENIEEVERLFGVVSRFWRSEDDFIQKANAVLIYSRGEAAGICYAAAEADRRAEIDVLTLPEHRNRGVGKYAVSRFVRDCFDKGIQPLWDCFTNNDGSMNLSRAMGFFAVNDRYPFFTINKSSQ